MPFAAPSMGVLTKLGTGTAASGTVSTAYEFVSESLAAQREIIRTDGLRGTRIHPVERLRQGRQTVNGQIVLEPTYAELATLLPFCLAAASAQSGYNTYTPSDTVPVAFDTIIDRVAKVFVYSNCRVGRATFSCAEGQPMRLALDIEALSETVNGAGTFGASVPSGTPPFVFADAVLSLASTAYQVKEWEITVDWNLKTDRFVNSLTRTDLPSTDLKITGKFTVPYTSDTVGLYDGGGGVAGIAGDLKLSYSGAGEGAAGVDLRFIVGNLVFPANKTPVVSGKDEIYMTLEGECRKTGSTAPLVVDLDSTIA